MSLRPRSASAAPTRASVSSTSVSTSLSTITRVWNDRLRASSTAREGSVPVEKNDIMLVTPSPKSQTRFHRGSALSSLGSLSSAASGDEDGLTDTPAAATRPRSSSFSSKAKAYLDSTVSTAQDQVTLRCRETGAGCRCSPSRSVDPNAEEFYGLAKPLFPRTLLTDMQDEGRVLTLVLDLDETLVCNRDARQSAAVLRPYCLHVLNALRHMKELEIILWTASTKETASPVVEQLHQTGIIFDDIVFRNNLWFTSPIHTKDLRLLGRDMDRVLIVDNSIGCCKLHPQNSLLLEDFHGVRRRSDAALVNVYYVVDALLRMLREGLGTVAEGLQCLVAEGQLCHTVNYELPEFFKRIPLRAVPELKRPPVGRFICANTAPPNTSIMQHWVY